MTAVTLRPRRASDLPTLLLWLHAEHVTPWWRDRPSDLAAVEQKYGPRIRGEDPIRMRVVEVDGSPAGFVQWCSAGDYAWWPNELGLDGAVAIDGLLGETSWLGRGLAITALKALVDDIVDSVPATSAVIACTRTGNRPAWRTFERAGFDLVFEGDLVRDGLLGYRVYSLSLAPTG